MLRGSGGHGGAHSAFIEKVWFCLQRKFMILSWIEYKNAPARCPSYLVELRTDTRTAIMRLRRLLDWDEQTFTAVTYITEREEPCRAMMSFSSAADKRLSSAYNRLG